MNWFKRYLVSCLIALFILAGADSYRHPFDDMRVGALVVVSATWPAVAAIVIGSSVGDVAREIHQGKQG